MNPRPKYDYGKSMKKSKSFHKSMVDIVNSYDENEPFEIPIPTSFVTKPFSYKRSNDAMSTPCVFTLKESTLKSIDLDWFANKSDPDTSQCTTDSNTSSRESSICEYELSINGSADSVDELDDSFPSLNRFSFSKEYQFPLHKISSRRYVAIKKWASEHTIGVNEVCQTICFNTACKQLAK